MNARQRSNLLKLATYLESLPADYEHFDMERYTGHFGDCDLPMSVDELAAKKPHLFFENCGTVACAVGHGPAAGIRLRDEEINDSRYGPDVRWYVYADRAFGSDEFVREISLFDFLFSGDWADTDNTHYGAAARIRYYLDTGRAFYSGSSRRYAPYRKGSRSAKRREIDAASAMSAGTAETQSGSGLQPASAARGETPK